MESVRFWAWWPGHVVQRLSLTAISRSVIHSANKRQFLTCGKSSVLAPIHLKEWSLEPDTMR